MRKFLLIVVVTLLTLICLPSFAHNMTPDGFSYSLNADGTLTLNGYIGIDSNLIIPSQIDGSTVSAIAERAFFQNEWLVNVTLPDSITSVGIEAFSYCPELRSISFPQSLTSLPKGVLSFCSMLSSIKFSDSLTSIDDFAFEGCSHLGKFVVPESVSFIGYDAFMSCENLILDCSLNPYAADYASLNNINSDINIFQNSLVIITAAIALPILSVLIFLVCLRRVGKVSK